MASIAIGEPVTNRWTDGVTKRKARRSRTGMRYPRTNWFKESNPRSVHPKWPPGWRDTALAVESALQRRGPVHHDGQRLAARELHMLNGDEVTVGRGREIRPT